MKQHRICDVFACDLSIEKRANNEKKHDRFMPFRHSYFRSSLLRTNNLVEIVGDGCVDRASQVPRLHDPVVIETSIASSLVVLNEQRKLVGQVVGDGQPFLPIFASTTNDGQEILDGDHVLERELVQERSWRFLMQAPFDFKQAFR